MTNRTTTHCDACGSSLACLDFWIVPTAHGPRVACVDPVCVRALKSEPAQRTRDDRGAAYGTNGNGIAWD